MVIEFKLRSKVVCKLGVILHNLMVKITDIRSLIATFMTCAAVLYDISYDHI